VLAFQDLEQMTVYGAALANAGICYARLGEFDRAIATQRRAVKLHERGAPKVDVERGLGELGNSFLQLGDPGQAVPHLRQALNVASDANLQGEAGSWAGNFRW